ncbi:cation:proton antiporter [Ectothiorhodospira mobilis]|uniref:cation:proton antiporter n=1 Tax=Ectothiorhodospira mobilis TaxID=195064 RepID=UPI001904F645|nr:monovalent cation/H(+) antiporter subunit G [Ectothiorhodospira mobilis]MBK1692937.1 cation:proton antiporter [Ectothiorhodospira mobilis]
MIQGIGMALIGIGLVFFAAGSIGMLRFPDVFTRLHALTKADNLGLGLVVLGLLPQVGGMVQGLKLLLIWGLVLVGSAVGSHLVAQGTLCPGRRMPARGEDDDG